MRAHFVDTVLSEEIEVVDRDFIISTFSKGCSFAVIDFNDNKVLCEAGDEVLFWVPRKKVEITPLE